MTAPPIEETWFRVPPSRLRVEHMAGFAFRHEHAALKQRLHLPRAANATVIDGGSHRRPVTRLRAGLLPAGRAVAVEPGRDVASMVLAARRALANGHWLFRSAAKA